MRFIGAALLLCACTEVEIIPGPGEGGGGSVADPVGGEAPLPPSSGGGGAGGEPTTRTIVVDLDAPEGADISSVVVLLSAPDGTIRETWLGDQLPVDAQAEDGDLITYATGWFYTPRAFMYRVTPEVTEVQSDAWLSPPFVPCNDPGPPMTVILDMPEVENANYFDVGVTGGNFLLLSSLQPGLNETEIAGCGGATSFDLVMVGKEYGNTDPFVFGRIDDLPYQPGETVTIPVELSTERALVDIVVEGEPGMTFGAKAYWDNDELWTETSTTGVLDDTGTSELAYGPFDLGDAFSFVRVSNPPEPFLCEIDSAWKFAPFDGGTLYARFGALAAFAPQADGNVALASEGEIGDVMVRTEHAYMEDVIAYWALYEDPLHPYPMPVKPEIPADLLPDFMWPAAGAELRYIHEDREATEGYADFARANPQLADGRSRARVPDSCF